MRHMHYFYEASGNNLHSRIGGCRCLYSLSFRCGDSRKLSFRCIRFPETQRYEEGRSVVAAPAFDVQSLGSLAGALYGLYALALFLEAEVLVAALIGLGLCRLWFATTILGCEDEDGQ